MNLPADDGKRTELLSLKATERVALDVLRAASNEDRSISDWLYRLIRRELYGTIARIDSNGESQS